MREGSSLSRKWLPFWPPGLFPTSHPPLLTRTIPPFFLELWMVLPTSSIFCFSSRQCFFVLAFPPSSRRGCPPEFFPERTPFTSSRYDKFFVPFPRHVSPSSFREKALFLSDLSITPFCPTVKGAVRWCGKKKTHFTAPPFKRPFRPIFAFSEKLSPPFFFPPF